VDLASTILTYVKSQLIPIDKNQSVGEDTLLFGDGYLDSTAMLELVVWISDRFDIKVQNEDLIPENFASIRNIADYVERNNSAHLNTKLESV
jgi:acyl carrier protein